MTALSQDGLEHKTRVEHDFWRPALDRSLEAWLLAPNNEKTDLLLNGQILNWAESWLLTHPTDVSANQRNFILRSLAAQQRKSSGQREQLVRTQTRKESRYIWVIMGCAFVALIPTINDFKKDLKQELKRELVKHVLDGQQPSNMRVVLRALVKKLRGIEDDTEVVEQRRRRLAQQQREQEGTDRAAPDSVSGDDPARRPSDEIAVAHAPEYNAADLAKLARRLSQDGDARRAMQVALEFFGETTKLPQTPTEKRRQLDAMSGAYAAAASQIQVIPADEWAPHASALQFCGDMKRIIGSTERGGLKLFDRGPAASAGGVAAGEAPLDLAAISRDCARAIVLNADGDGELVATATGKTLARLGGHPTTIFAAGFSDDGRRIVTLSRDPVAKIWNGQTGRPVANVTTEDQAFTGAALSPDGATLVTWSGEKFAEIWDTATGDRVHRLTGYMSAVTNAVFDPSGEIIATTSNDGLLRIWERASRKLLAMVRGHEGALTIARFSPDGKRIATLAGDAQVSIWETRTGAPVTALVDPESATRNLAFSRDGKFVATSNWSGSASLWRLDTGERLAELNPVGETLTGIAFETDASRVLAFTAEGALMQWPVLATPAAVAQHAGRTASACLTVEERRSLRLRPQLPAWCKSAPESETAPSDRPEVGSPQRQ